MNLKNEVISIMSNWAPEDTAESWDNVGLQLDTNREISRIAVVLELNLDTWDIIQQYDYDLIISHHPLIFKPLKAIGHDDWTQNVVRELIRKDVGLYVSHTNLDRASDGVSDILMRQYELVVSSSNHLVDGYGKVAYFAHPLEIEQLDDKVPSVAKVIPEDLEINSVAFMGGSGKSIVNEVVAQGIDVLVTGELGYHEIQHIRQQKVGLFLLGHYQSEVFILDTIRDRLSHLNIEIDVIK
ncbi:MAG: Nif3-like dinuclear metal center hexameric protein [Candidatus Marinamargulisbacteria bacterium]